MKNYFSRWNLSRILRLALGIIILAHGIESHEWLLAAFGSFIVLMPILNIGCCGTSCSTSYISKEMDLTDTTYKEIK